MNPLAHIFGSYWETNSFVHKLDARVKLSLVLLFLIVCFQTTQPAVFVMLALLVAVSYRIARIPARIAWQATAPLLFIVVGALLLNVFFREGEIVYASWGPFCISNEGIIAAGIAVARLILVLFWSSLHMLCTTSLDTSDALANMLRPLSKIHVPVHEIALMMGMVFRFIPQLAEEAFVLIRAQQNRGAQFSIGGKSGTSSVFSLVSGVFSNALRHVDSLSDAMDARCYHDAQSRSRLKPFQLKKKDLLTLAVIAGLLCCLLPFQFYLNLNI